MKPEDERKVKEICEETMSAKIESVKTIAKWSLGSAAFMFSLCVGAWFVTNGQLYRLVHDLTFPPAELKIQPDTVLITTYSKDFILKKKVNDLDFITFYSEPGQKVEYVVAISHLHEKDDSLKLRFTIELDSKLITKKPTLFFDKKLRTIKVHLNDDDVLPDNFHQFGFRLDPKQNIYSPKAEVIVSCVVMVSGNQYHL